MSRILTRRLKLYPTRAIFPLAILLLSCNIEQRDPRVELSGNTEWFSHLESAESYLLDTIDSEGRHQLEWPPEAHRTNIDISFDVTGSVFDSEVHFSGRTQPRGHYNVEKLVEFLQRTETIQPGDEIFLRVFGELPGGREVTIDEYKVLSSPPSEITLNARILSRRHNDLLLQVEEIREPDAYELFQDIRFWYNEKAEKAQNPNNTFERSPLLRHIGQVLAIGRSRPTKAFIFVTDGHFHVGDLYFHPASFTSGLTAEQVRREAEEIGLLPPEPSPEVTAQVILLGLDDGGGSSFAQAQESILGWFLQNYKMVIVRR